MIKAKRIYTNRFLISSALMLIAMGVFYFMLEKIDGTQIAEGSEVYPGKSQFQSNAIVENVDAKSDAGAKDISVVQPDQDKDIKTDIVPETRQTISPTNEKSVKVITPPVKPAPTPAPTNDGEVLLPPPPPAW